MAYLRREKAGLGKLFLKGAKSVVSGAKKVDDNLERFLDKAQGIKEGPKDSTDRTPGATATNRGAVVGKKRTDVFGKTKVIKGGLYTGLTSVGLNLISNLFEDTDPSDLSIISTANADSNEIYTPSELPTEGAASIEGDDFFIYKNPNFKNAAIAASMDNKQTFKFSGDGQEYETKRVLNTFNFLEKRTKKAIGGKVIYGLLDRLIEQAANKSKKKIRTSKVSQDLLEQRLGEDPQFIDKLSDDDFNELISALPAKSAELLGGVDDATLGIIETNLTAVQSLSPKEAAKNLELFNEGGVDAIEDYLGSLNVMQLREFRDNLSPKDRKDFAPFIEGYFQMLKPRQIKLTGGQAALDKNNNNKIDSEDFKLLREKKQEGGMKMPPEMEPELVDTYPNIPPSEMEAALASQLPDDQMEDEYINTVLDQSLTDREQNYLADKLEEDDVLSDIVDKLVLTASEFSGSGMVSGPGTGVSDSIPARLSDGEFVITKKATDQIGAENLQQMMDDAERAYDGGQMRTGAQLGGLQELDPELEKATQGKIDEEIKKVMINSNKIPSVL